MPWESYIGTRYLFRGRRTGKFFVFFLLWSIAMIAGGALLSHFGARILGILFLSVGALGAVISGLLWICSVFTTVSVFGVVLGVAALAIVLSVTSGFQTAFQEKILGVNAHVIVTRDEPDFYEYRQMIGRAKKLPHVIGVAPFMLAEMLMAHPTPGGPPPKGILLKGVEPPASWSVLDLPHHLLEGSLDGLSEPAHTPASSRAPASAIAPASGPTAARATSDPPGIVIGKLLAESLKVKVGDVVTVISPLAGYQTENRGPSPAPRFRRFRVIGIFYSGFDEYDRRLAYVALPETQAFLGLGDVVTGVEMKLDDPERAHQVGELLERELRDPHYQVIDWRGLNHNLFTALALQKVVLTLVLALIIAVAAFNIIATMTMMVIDKTREIAILKSMGATSGGIGRLFVSVGTTIGAIGTAFGLSLGYLLCVLLRDYGYPLDSKIYLIDKLPVKILPAEFAITAAITMAICILASVYPAQRASRLLPVEGLRYD